MEKNKTLFITLVVIFCVVLAGGACFYLGTRMNPDTSENENKDETKNEDVKSSWKQFEVPDYYDSINNTLYNYLKSDNKSLDDYLNNLSNNHKLYLAGIVTYDHMSGLNDEVSFNSLKNNLLNYFGSDLGIKQEDYYISQESEESLLYKYNENKDAYIINENVTAGDCFTDMDNGEIYNYKLDKIQNKDDSIILTYYGLYAYPDEVGPTTLTNNKNIERSLAYDQETDGLSDEVYLSNSFNKNKNDFFKFVYTYKLVDGKYVLVDFKQE